MKNNLENNVIQSTTEMVTDNTVDAVATAPKSCVCGTNKKTVILATVLGGLGVYALVKRIKNKKAKKAAEANDEDQTNQE